MKYASLFSGIGGFELGITKAAIETQTKAECIFASEIDKHARTVYNNNYGVEPHGDITKIESASIGNIDMLVGGFPCQAFSQAGKRRGFDDTRGTLFFEIARICKETRPTIVFCENVKGLLNHDGGRTFGTILLTMAELGYVAEWQLLNSKNFGVPQNRERVYIIFHLAERCRGQIFPIRETEKIYTESRKDKEGPQQTAPTLMANQNASCTGNFIIHGQNNDRIMEECSPTLCSRMGTGGNNVPYVATHSLYPRSATKGKGGTGQLSRNDGISYCLDCGNNQAVEVKAVLTPERLNKRQNGRRIKEHDEPSFTVTAQDKHGVMIGNEIRKLTPVECERLQGFPDNWTNGVSDSQRYKQLGNAVTVNVIHAIATKILNIYGDEHK